MLTLLPGISTPRPINETDRPPSYYLLVLGPTFPTAVLTHCTTVSPFNLTAAQCFAHSILYYIKN